MTRNVPCALTLALVGSCLMALLTSSPLAAQGGCPPGTLAGEGELNKLLEEERAKAADDDANLVAKANDVADIEIPLAAPPANQAAAPASVPGGTSLVDASSFPEVFALALENDIVQAENNVLTLNLNPFLLTALVHPEVLDNASVYSSPGYSRARRVGLTASFGGKGESFDRDGDGVADPALEAKHRTDIVTWEARIRVFGSRDRLEHFGRYKEALKDEVRDDLPFANSSAAWMKLINALKERLRPCATPAEVVGFLEEPELHELLLASAFADTTLEKAAKDVDKSIDRAPVWTLAVGGTDREPQYGPNKLKAALRGDIAGEKGRNLTLNLEWLQTDGLAGLADPTTWRLAAEGSVLKLAGTRLGGTDGIKVSFSGAYEMFDDVPGATHDTNVKLNGKLELPLAKGLNLPVSITWANHEDLISEDDELSAHVGFTLSWGDLLKGRK